MSLHSQTNAPPCPWPKINCTAWRRFAESGWLLLKLSGPSVNAETLHRIGREFGEVVASQSTASVDTLSPRINDNEARSSLSGKFGLDEFPLHNDTAHWTVPARVIVLGCIKSSLHDIPTYLCDTHKIVLSSRGRQLVEASVFFVHNGRFSFYTSILCSNRKYIRCDPGCMEAEDDNATEALELFSRRKLEKYCNELILKPGDILIIDNWRTLHGRGFVAKHDMDRRLLRVYVL